MIFEKIYVRPRSHVATCTVAAPYAAVAIHNVEGPQEPTPLRLNQTIRAALWLEFQDFDSVRWPHELTQIWRNGMPMKDMAMQPHHGRALWSFLRGLPEDVHTLLINCNAAASRSPSMAMAIADVLKLPRSVIDWSQGPGQSKNPNEDPANRYVYKMVVETASAFTKSSDAVQCPLDPLSMTR